MRIACLCADRGVSVSGSKGASIHLRAVAQSLAQRGHEVTVVTSREAEAVLGFRPRVVSTPFDRTLKDLRKSVGEAAGDPTLGGEIHGLLLNALCESSLAEVDRRGLLDAIYERYSLWSTAGLRFARRRGIPWVLEVNAPLVQEQEEFRQLRLREAAVGIERHLFAAADAIFVPAAELKEHIFRQVGRRKRVYVVPNGADLEMFLQPRPLPPEVSARLEGKFVAAFVGSLKPWHGVETLLAAHELLVARAPEAHLLMVGKGPLLPQVLETADRLGPDHVTVTGEVTHAEIPAWLRHADVGLAPYPAIADFYFSPLKVIEYMAAGLPVVASSIGQIRQLVRHGETGLLVSPGDADELAAALVRLATQARLRKRMGESARRRAAARHSWKRVAGQIERVLEELRSRKGRRRARTLALAPKLSARGGRR